MMLLSERTLYTHITPAINTYGNNPSVWTHCLGISTYHLDPFWTWSSAFERLQNDVAMPLFEGQFLRDSVICMSYSCFIVKSMHARCAFWRQSLNMVAVLWILRCGSLLLPLQVLAKSYPTWIFLRHTLRGIWRNLFTGSAQNLHLS